MKACLRIFMAILVSLMLSTVVIADDDDDDGDLEGAWGFIATGTMGGTPATGVGPITFYEDGTCTFTPWFNAGGLVIPLTTEADGGSCTYTVNTDDGTGTIDLVFVNPLVGPFPLPGNPTELPFFVQFVIVDEKNELLLIVGDPTNVTVASGVAKKQ